MDWFTKENESTNGKLNDKKSVQQSYREVELKKVAQMTDRNQHLEAEIIVTLAGTASFLSKKKGGYTKHEKSISCLY